MYEVICQLTSYNHSKMCLQIRTQHYEHMKCKLNFKIGHLTENLKMNYTHTN